MKHKTILLGLNELNFDYIKHYINKGLLPNFKYLFAKQAPIETISESEYKLLEPWIQWASIHTGKTFNEHKIFRLGDIVDYPNVSQLFEELEKAGLSVGAVSPFNAENRLINPAFFVPDPWTKTTVSGNWIVKSLYRAVHQSVNDNAQEKFNFKSLLSFGLGFLLYVPVSRWLHYIKCIIGAKKPGAKAVILDSLLADVFIKLWKNKKPDFSNLFLNSGAHIQHHYLFNSSAYKGDLKNPSWYCEAEYDPLIRILSEYDTIIGKLLKFKYTKLIIATGLHQQPHEHLTFYWRLKEHVKFANVIGIENFKEILPRMSRDFLVNFHTEKEAEAAEELLNSYYSLKDNVKIFDIDNRGTSLFAEFVYSNNISSSDSIYSKVANKTIENYKSYLAFVAIKNGEHNGLGYVTSNFELKVNNQIFITDLKAIIKDVALHS